MSKSALEALKLCGLLDKNGKACLVDKIPPIELQKKIDYYRDTRVRLAEKDATESIPTSQDMAGLVSSVSASNAVVPLLPSCLFYNRLYTNDPLISLARTPNDIAKAHNAYFGMNSDGLPDPERVANKLLYFEKLAPLIDLGCLCVLPLEELHSPPTDGLPIFYSEDWFRSDVPAHIHDFVHKNAIISEVAPGPDRKGFIVLNEAPKVPTRGICISFANDSAANASSFYLLFEQKVIRKIDEDHYEFSQRLDWDNPPDKAMFDAWVYQSINKTIIARLGCASREFSVAEQLRATYLTESDFESKVCGMSSSAELKPGQDVSAVNFLTANAPYLKLDDPLALARLRGEHGYLFERWQLSLLSVADELTGVTDDFDHRAKQLFEKEIRPQLDELNTALFKMAGGAAGASLLTAGTIGMALLSSATLPFAAVLGLGALAAGGRAVPSAAEYAAKRKGPAFIWSKITR